MTRPTARRHFVRQRQQLGKRGDILSAAIEAMEPPRTFVGRVLPSVAGVNQSTFDRGIVTPASANPAPVVAISAPVAGAVFLPGATVALSATASEAGGTITGVQFFANSISIGTATFSNGIYSYSWKPAVGSYKVTAVATSSFSTKTTSAAVSIRVDSAPTASITSPVSGAVFLPGFATTITATASDLDGAVKSVQFFDNNVSVGQGTSVNGVWSAPWTKAAPGIHTLTAVATDNDGATYTAHPDNVRVDQAPGTSITSPASGASYAAGSAITLQAKAADNDGTVQSVEFFADGNALGVGKLASGTTASGVYTFTWSAPVAGAHSITAVATDNNGAVTSSTAIALTERGPLTVAFASLPPVVLPGTPIVLTATASEISATITNVAFQADGTSLGNGVLTAGVYAFTWNNAKPGTHTISAIATDSTHATASVKSTLRVDALSTVSVTAPVPGAVIAITSTVVLSAKAADTDGTVANVEFFADGKDLGPATLAGTAYALTWNGAMAGTHQVTAIALDNDGGKTTSAAVSFRVDAGPVVAISVPSGGTVVLPGTPIALSATASESGGSVTHVEFYADGQDVGAGKLGGGVYSYVWASAPVGSHQITAVASDNYNVQTTSAAAGVRVDALPVVLIAAPTAGAVFQPSSTIALSAAATDSDGTIAQVEFFADGNDLGTATLSGGVYSLQWSSASIATHSITAIATDNDGGQSTSTPVSVRVDAPPVVAVVTTAAGSVSQPGAAIPLSVSASDSDGTVANVEFYTDGADLGTATLVGGVYTLNWTSAAIGTHQINAVATDNDGAMSVSVPFTLRVDAPPAVSMQAPADGTVYQPGATINLSAQASDSDGSVTNVEFFDGSTDLGGGTFSGGVYSLAWNGAAIGTHLITAVATDNDGAITPSSIVSLRVNQPPAVSLTSPADGAVVQLNTPVVLTASAADADGTISNVEFYAGQTDLGAGTLVGNAYSLTWANVPAGSYSITTAATDNDGATTISAAASIRVNAPPTVAITSPIGEVIAAGAAIDLSATAADSDGTISNVEFFADGADLGAGVLSGGAYSFGWTDVGSGPHQIIAIATDNDGAQMTSTSASITVDPPPAVTLTALGQPMIVQQGADADLSASASDVYGQVASVEFYADGQALGAGELVGDSYVYDWSVPPTGSHQVTAVATDSVGNATTSAALAVFVNQPPTISLTSPPEGTVFQPGNAIALSASAADTDGSITNVEFFADGTVDLGSGAFSGVAYTLNWTDALVGTHQITAVATDNDSGVGTSNAVHIRVNALPTVALTAPTDGTVVQPGTSVTLSATASDSDGSIAGVEFFADGNDLGAGTLAGGDYSLNWPTAAIGTHQITAIATDNDGGQMTASPVSFRVNNPPSITLSAPTTPVYLPGAAITISATASDADGSIANVEFFADGADLGPGTLSAGVYSVTWPNAAIGAHQITAVATDNDGASTKSGAVGIRMDSPPVAAMTSPVSGTFEPFGSAIALSAQGSDSDGTVVGMEFYSDGVDIGPGALAGGASAAGTWSMQWNTTLTGPHQITAVATDNDGATATTTAAVQIVVDTPPIVAVTSPLMGAVLPGGAPIALTASATNPQAGAIAGVRFIADGTSLGAATLANGIFTYIWTNPSSGPHAVAAIATDVYGTTATSAAENFTVQTNAVIVATTPLTMIAGHPVNVEALASSLSAGTPLTTRYAWDFGDTTTGSQFNDLVGFNASHEYDTPGNYTVTLTVTDQTGYAVTATANVVITAAPTRTIYVAAAGSDTNDGLSPITPLRSFAKAMTKLTSNTSILFNDGDTFNVESLMNLNNVQNVTFGSYGIGANPTLLWDGARTDGDGFFQIYSPSANITVRNLTFDSVFTTDTEETAMPFAVRTAGTNIAVIGDTFLNVGDAVDASLRPTGLLVEDNIAPLVTGLRAYFTWVEGSDVVIVGNTVANSTREHIVRVSGSGGTRVLVEDNNLTNMDRTGQGDPSDIAKSTIAAQNGSYLYVANNMLNSGPAGVGPLNRSDLVNDPVQQASNFQWAVFDSNTFYCPLLLQPGAAHVMIRNNIAYRPNVPMFTINGYDSNYHREVVDASFVANTVIDMGTQGQFLNTTGPALGLQLVDNLYIAPNLVMGVAGAAPVYIQESTLASFSRISHNVWPTGNPNIHAKGGVNYLWPYWFNASGYLTPIQWNSQLGVDSDIFVNAAVDSTGAPISPVSILGAGVAMPGLFTDFYGDARGLIITPGAVIPSANS